VSENKKTPQEIAREILSKVSKMLQEKTQPLEKKEKVEDPKMEDTPLSKCGEMKKEEEKKNPSFDREKKDKEWTAAQTKMVNATKPGKIASNRKDQEKHINEAKARRDKMRQEGLIKEEKHVNSKDQNVVKETKGIEFDKPSKEKIEKCGEMKKEEKNRCWEGYKPTPGKKAYEKGSCEPMKKSELSGTSKLAEFLNKRK
jgi:hypothetical protein